MLNKLMFNNLVISNKKGIQQSRIQTINKLVHKIRKLNTILEKHPNDKKCKERIRKSTETVELLKKFKRVEIMRKVLLMEKQPAAVITNGLATPEEVAVALLSMNKVMLALIKRFRTELLLDESKREEWQKVLSESSKRLQKKERTLERRRKRLEMKQQKTIGRKRQEWLEQNYPEGENKYNDNVNSVNLNISTTGNWNVEKLSKEDQGDKNQNIEEVALRTLTKRPLKEKNKASMPNKKQNKDTEIEYENQNEMDAIKTENSLVEFEDDKDHESVEEDNELSLVVDPFFITATGENYLSASVIRNHQSAKEDSDEEVRDLHITKLKNYGKMHRNFKDRRQQTQSKNPKDFRNKLPTLRSQKHEDKTNSEMKRPYSIDHKRKVFNSNKSVRETNGQNLHPSWAAKQKLKPVITGFQGKKIKFGDEAESSNVQKALDQCKNTKPSSLESCNAENNSLHPSWAAKQKLKPTIIAFQGKKITFDNDD